jgi:hypothetical protein
MPQSRRARRAVEGGLARGVLIEDGGELMFRHVLTR